ncbi:MAG: cytochrome ubiquinol oxidase subunit I [Geminicoccaceae bacterium]
MDLDPLILSRLQFAWVVAFHILLPAFTIGLASFIAMLEGVHLVTKRQEFLRLSNFWVRIFAISFGMGVVSGIVMPFQLGTNWSRYSDHVGDVVSPLLGYESLMAFFLEATFLGILLFGRKLVPVWAHFGAAVMVAVGTLMSAFWILAVNSWMQTPQGFVVGPDGRFQPADWLEIIFTPSLPYRLAHNVTGFYVTTAFVVLGVGAWLLHRGRGEREAKVMMGLAVAFLTITVPLQMVLGDMHGLNTREHQPAKLAAMEGLWETGRGVPASLFAIPDQEAETNLYEIAIPKLGSLYLTHSWDGEVQGLKAFPPEDRPPVAIVYFAFRIMVGMGILMLVVIGTCWVLAARGRLFEPGWHTRLLPWCMPMGFIAVIAGWTTTEVGRQPWTVYGHFRTADSVTPSLTGSDVLLSLLSYMVVYLIVFPAGVYFMAQIVRRGPVVDTPQSGLLETVEETPSGDFDPAAVALGRAPRAGN